MLNKKMIDIMFKSPTFKESTAENYSSKWRSSDKALNAMLDCLKDGGMFMPELITRTKYSQPSVSQAIKILANKGKVSAVRCGYGKPVYCELVQC